LLRHLSPNRPSLSAAIPILIWQFTSQMLAGIRCQTQELQRGRAIPAISPGMNYPDTVIMSFGVNRINYFGVRTSGSEKIRAAPAGVVNKKQLAGTVIVSKKMFPEFVPPMMAENAKVPFDSSDWIFEIKLDGYRAVASKKAKMYAYSRTTKRGLLTRNCSMPETVTGPNA
jgi:hypothetical protein